MNQQLENHKVTINRITHLLGNESAKEHLSKCFYFSVMGSNDYINNYFLPEFYPNTTQIYTPDEYATVLVEQYTQQIMVCNSKIIKSATKFAIDTRINILYAALLLQALYDLGAKKIAVAGLGPIGCIPYEKARYKNITPCIDTVNDAVKQFNDKLKLRVDDMNKNITDSKFVYISSMTGSPTEIFGIAGNFSYTLFSVKIII